MDKENQFNRYDRQMLVNEVGVVGQHKLTSAKVLIVGAGGLGCVVAAQLAGAGVGELHIIDYDTIELSNLHRQILFRETDIGQAKANVAARECRHINHQCNVITHTARLSLNNVQALSKDMSVVVDAADNFATTYLLSDHCKAHNTALVSASVNRTFGYVGQFCRNAPSVRAVFPRLPKQAQSCDTVGVLGPSVGMIASLQAQETLKAILDDSAQLSGRLLYAELWNYRLQEIDFNHATEPGNEAMALLSLSDLDQGDLLIDVRSAQEIAAAPHSANNIVHLELSQLLTNTEQLPRDVRLVCACQSGQRALIAAQLLIDQGFKKVAAMLPD